MNKVAIGIISGITGAAIGAFVMRMYDNKRQSVELAQILDEELDKNDEYWKRRIGEVLYDDADAKDENVVKTEEGSKPRPTRESIVKGRVRKESEYTNYSNFYQAKPSLEEVSKFVEDTEENVDIVEELIERDAYDENMTDEEVLEKQAKLITYEDFDLGFHQFDKDTLYYYSENDTLVTEDEELVENENIVIGNCLDKYDFRHSDEDVIYVRSYNMRTDYEIRKVRSIFSGV